MVSIPIPDPWRTQLREIQDRFRPPGWRITMEPHITVLAPDRPLLPEEKAAESFAALNIHAEPFSIIAAKLGVFDRRQHHTLTLLPEANESLHTVYSALLQAETWQENRASTKRPYEPHITLVNQLPKNQALDVFRELEGLHLRVEFECTAIGLYAKRAGWPSWLELETYRL